MWGIYIPSNLRPLNWRYDGWGRVCWLCGGGGLLWTFRSKPDAKPFGLVVQRRNERSQSDGPLHPGLSIGTSKCLTAAQVFSTSSCSCRATSSYSSTLPRRRARVEGNQAYQAYRRERAILRPWRFRSWGWAHQAAMSRPGGSWKGISLKTRWSRCLNLVWVYTV